MSRKTKQDWVRQGAIVLAEAGAGQIKIDLLTKRLGVTKGSFYHHFKNYQDYQENLLRFIEEKGTIRILEQLEQLETPAEKIDKLQEIMLNRALKSEINLRAWAMQDTLVRSYQERIDRQRIEYLEKVFAEMFEDPVQAKAMAHTLLTIYIGCQQVLPPVEPDEIKQIFKEFQRLY